MTNAGKQAVSVNSRSSDEFELELSILVDLCRIESTPRSLLVLLLVQYEQWDQLVHLSIDPSNYLYSEEDFVKFQSDYLVTEFLRKSPNVPLEIDRYEEARRSFMVAEARCLSTNSRINQQGSNPELQVLLHAVSNTIGKILPPINSEILEKIESSFSFGPGSTTLIKGTFRPEDKYSDKPHLTSNLYPFYRSILGDRWQHYADQPSIVSGDKFTSVPKNARTDRGICIPPCLNSYVQHGIGSQIRRYLLESGCDISTQEKNQFLASKARIRSLCTHDLKGASDTISYELVKDILPRDWFSLLEVARCRNTTFKPEKGEKSPLIFPLSKYSSMGNGYTFELETLIFLSVVRTYVPKTEWDNVAVYGDDMIYPSQYADDIQRALDLLGFETNTEKSFMAGAFYESCGADFFMDRPVRPFYARGATTGIPYPVQLANRLREYSHQSSVSIGSDSRYRNLWKRLVSLAPKVWRKCRIPYVLGDCGIIDDHNGCRYNRLNIQNPPTHVGKGVLVLPLQEVSSWEGNSYHVVSLAPKKVKNTSFSFLLCRLYSLGNTFSTPYTASRLGARNHFSIGDPILRRLNILSGHRTVETAPTNGYSVRKGLFGKEKLNTVFVKRGFEVDGWEPPLFCKD